MDFQNEDKRKETFLSRLKLYKSQANDSGFPRMKPEQIKRLSCAGFLEIELDGKHNTSVEQTPLYLCISLLQQTWMMYFEVFKLNKTLGKFTLAHVLPQGWHSLQVELQSWRHEFLAFVIQHVCFPPFSSMTCEPHHYTLTRVKGIASFWVCKFLCPKCKPRVGESAIFQYKEGHARLWWTRARA